MVKNFGRSSGDIGPKQAAHENRILVCLEKRGPLREREVKLYTTSTRQVEPEIHNLAVKSLISAGFIHKLSTTRANSFILELTGKQRNPLSPIGVEAIPEPDRLTGRLETYLRSRILLRDQPVITHLGRSGGDIDPKQAAHENRILVCLEARYSAGK